MQHARLQGVILLTAVLAAALPTAADTLIYDNTQTNYYYLPQQAYQEILDYGTSPGGRVSKFVIDYVTELFDPGAVTIRFYTGTYLNHGGSRIKTFTLTDLPGSPTGLPWGSTVEYIIPEAQRFELPGGSFGYSYEFQNDYCGPTLAYGGTGNQNYLLEYWYGDWYGFQVSGSWAGYYMKVYTAPPLNETTCTINGYIFNDLNGDSVWDNGEPALPGWEVYLDMNLDGDYQSAEPNVVADPNGFYQFNYLPSPATYTLRQILPPGWTQTLPGPDAGYQYTVATDPNNTYGPYYFGVTDQLVSEITISGYVRTTENVRVKGINISADTGQTARTDANGYYELSVLSPYSGVITVDQMDWILTPSSRSYISVAADQIEQNYTAAYTAGYGGGSGTAISPYLIYSAAQLNRIGARAADWNKHFRLMADIDLAGYDGKNGRPAFNRIGCYINFVDMRAFTGVFDGGGKTVSKFTFESDVNNHAIGLFAYISGAAAEIRNLHLADIHIASEGAGTFIGSLIGNMSNGIVRDCSVTGVSIASQGSAAGGLVGIMSGGTLSKCSAQAAVSGNLYVGGLAGSVSSGSLVLQCAAYGTVIGKMAVGGLIGSCGSSQAAISFSGSSGTVAIDYSSILDRTAGGLVGDNNGTIAYCYSDAAVTGNNADEIGGLVGRHKGILSNSYASGAVSGRAYIGGLAGVCWDGQVANCYSIGSVIASGSKGGLIGHNLDGTCQIISSFWDLDASGLLTSNGGDGLTTEQMQTRQTFLDAAWDMQTIWRLCHNGINYPVLNWSYALDGDFVCPEGVGTEDLILLTDEWLMEVAELPADMVPEGGDGVVDLQDWPRFARAWLTYPGHADWDTACNLDDSDDIIDACDLLIFTDLWLLRTARIADISPDDGDGIVNMLDFAALAENWLAGGSE